MGEIVKAGDVMTLGKRLREMAVHQAGLIAKEVQALLREEGSRMLRSEDGLKLLSLAMEDRAAEILKLGAVIVITDAPMRRVMSRNHAKQAGKRSGEVRAQVGQKAKFLAWALAQNKANPSLSKNDVAQRYAKANPGTSQATLRRYLAAVPNRYRDEED